MSFFDDDEPIRASRTRPARPRPSGSPRPRQTEGGGGSRRSPAPGVRRPDAETARQRQLVLAVAAIVTLILLVLLVNSCQNSRKERAVKDYNQAVTGIIGDSDQVGKDFFTALDAAASGGDVAVRVNQLRQAADEQVTRAKALDPRSELNGAQYALELVLNLRAQGLRKIADKLPAAQAQGRDNAQSAETAVTQIAGQMEQFLASDVVYSQRTAPLIREALVEAGVSNPRPTLSRFLPSLAWLDPNAVAGRLGSVRASGGQGADPNPAPGLHGHSLDSVSVGSVSLQPGTVSNRVPARPAPSFKVDFTNGGENDERDVVVTAKLEANGRSISRKKTIAQTKAGEKAEVTIPLGSTPPAGAATLTITVAKVPGEEKVDNNSQTYTILFTG